MIDETSITFLFKSGLFPPPEAWKRELRAFLTRLPTQNPARRKAIGSHASALEAMYEKPPRSYHILGHALETARRALTLAERLSDRLPESDEAALVLAALCHDAVYDLGRTGNEGASAAFAEAEALSLGLEPQAARRASRLVLATKHPDARPSDTPEALIRDADLSVLASPPADYRLYASLVRREASFLDDAAYTRARKSFIESFLTRGRLFFLEPWDRLLEDRARSNLRAELADM